MKEIILERLNVAAKLYFQQNFNPKPGEKYSLIPRFTHDGGIRAIENGIRRLPFDLQFRDKKYVITTDYMMNNGSIMTTHTREEE